jgi:hypothetical protein
MNDLENLAFKLLTAIKEESERETSLLKCRFMSELAQPLMSQDEFIQAQAYLFDNSLVDAFKRDGRYVTKPNIKGLSFLELHTPKPMALDNRLKIFTLIVALVAIFATVVFFYSKWK